jgi:hypothetical protein
MEKEKKPVGRPATEKGAIENWHIKFPIGTGEKIDKFIDKLYFSSRTDIVRKLVFRFLKENL